MVSFNEGHMFGRKVIKPVFNNRSGASGGASSDVTREWRYTTHPSAAELLDAAAARNATAKELADFLAGFSKSKAPQQYKAVDHDLDPDTVYIATRDFKMKPVFGAASIDIIIPKGITVTGKDKIGHASIYDMNDYTLSGGSYICVPRDVKRELVRQGCTLRDYAPPAAPPPPTPVEIGQTAAAHAQNGLPQAISVRRISLKQKVS
jgi:hypothetical protein